MQLQKDAPKSHDWNTVREKVGAGKELVISHPLIAAGDVEDAGESVLEVDGHDAEGEGEESVVHQSVLDVDPGTISNGLVLHVDVFKLF